MDYFREIRWSIIATALLVVPVFVTGFDLANPHGSGEPFSRALGIILTFPYWLLPEIGSTPERFWILGILLLFGWIFLWVLSARLLYVFFRGRPKQRLGA